MTNDDHANSLRLQIGWARFELNRATPRIPPICRPKLTRLRLSESRSCAAPRAFRSFSRGPAEPKVSY